MDKGHTFVPQMESTHRAALEPALVSYFSMCILVTASVNQYIIIFITYWDDLFFKSAVLQKSLNARGLSGEYGATFQVIQRCDL